MPWNEEQQRQARLMSSGSWPKREARKTTFRDVLRALGIASSPLDLTSQEPEGVRPDYGLTGAGLERRRRYPGEYFPGEATQADVAGALWNIVESAGVENLPGIGPHKTAKQAPGRVRPGHEAEFNEWFRGSKAVDADGKPLTLYHGTPHQFEEFEPNAEGIYLSGGPDVASAYAGRAGQVLPLHVRMERPYRLKPDDVMGKRNHELVREAKAKGHDGIIIDNSSHGIPNAYVVFDPSQIKSATGNRGTYRRDAAGIAD